jgi:uncharacterized protein with HEPN domain
MKHDKLSDKERIIHILDAVNCVAVFTEGYSFRDFKNDSKVYYACLYQFAVIGEAVAHIGNEMLKKYDYPWHKVKSFRNFIMHEYHAIDEKVVWDTIKLVLPGLQQVMEQILDKEFNVK